MGLYIDLSELFERKSTDDEEIDVDADYGEEEDDDSIDIDIDIDLKDESVSVAKDLKERKARPPKLKKRQRDANKVKSAVTKELLSEDSELKPMIDRIFKKVRKGIRKKAAKEGVPIGRINLNKLTIRA